MKSPSRKARRLFVSARRYLRASNRKVRGVCGLGGPDLDACYTCNASSLQGKPMRTYLFAGVCLLIGSSSAIAVDIFVDNVLGDDRRGGSSATVAGKGAGPCRSIAKALRITQPGDRIVIANTGQSYRERITVQGPRHSGSERFPTTIVGNGATLDGSVS